MKSEKRFLRKCVSCGKLKPKSEFIKITFNKTADEFKINPSEDFFGRSVYVCKDKNCIDNALRKDKFNKNLHKKLPEIIKQQIFTVLEK